MEKMADKPLYYGGKGSPVYYGGGQPAYATAGGKNLDGLDRAMQVAAELV